MRLLYPLLFCVLLAGTLLSAPDRLFAQSSGVHAELRAPQTQLQVGDEGEVILEASHDPGRSTLIWPQIPDSFGRLEVHNKGKIDTVRNAQGEIFRQRFTVSGFDSGVFTIPPFTIGARAGGGPVTEINTAPLSLLIQTLPVDTTKPIKPIKDIIAVQRVWTDSLPLILGGLALILAIILIAVFLKRRKPKPIAALPPPPKILPHIAALEALKRLEGEALWQKGELKEYYVQLTGIIRRYIEDAYHEPALESTTDELLDAVRRHPILTRGYARLQNILPMADLAKFAKAAPTAEEHVAALEGAVSFIQFTTPSPIVEKEEGGVQS